MTFAPYLSDKTGARHQRRRDDALLYERIGGKGGTKNTLQC